MEARFRYKSQNSRAAFVELAPEWRPTQEELYAWLEACPLVERVEWQSSKSSQGKIGNHYSEHYIKVFPKQQGAGSATQQFLLFGVTRHFHLSESAPCPYTVSVMFKDPPNHLLRCAWAILRDVCRGKELYPNKVEEWMMDVFNI